jgi:hypothetical protein
MSATEGFSKVLETSPLGMQESCTIVLQNLNAANLGRNKGTIHTPNASV